MEEVTLSQLRRSARKGKQRVNVGIDDYGEWEEPLAVESGGDINGDDIDSISATPKRKATPKSASKSQTSSARKRKQPEAHEAEEKGVAAGDEEKEKEENEDVKIDFHGPLSILYQSIAHPQGAVLPIVGQFLERFNKDRDEALAECSNFLLQSCGCKTSLPIEDIERESIDDLVTKAASAAHLASNDYPIVSRQKQFKNFKSRFSEFFGKLIQKTKGDLVYDDTFMNHWIDWLTAISGAGLKSFRHTASVAAFRVVSALSSLAAELEEQLNVNMTQLEAEEKKQRPAKTKIDQFKQDREELETHLSTIQELLKKLFEGVFAHRYRDTNPVIRALCMTSLSQWMSAYHQYFLKDVYLKYPGWCLYDKDASVRRAALDAIVSQYQDKDKHGDLEYFTKRFLQRFSEMVRDVDTRVAVAAIDFMTGLLRIGLLGEEDGKDIPSLIWDKDPNISKAAAQFMYEDHFAPPDDEKSDEKSEDEQKKQNQEDIVTLLDFFKRTVPRSDPSESLDELDLAVATQILVESLWDSLKCLQDWEVLTEQLLTQEQLKKSKKRTSGKMVDEDSQTVLAFIINACVFKATGQPLPALQKHAGKSTHARKELAEENIKALSTYFIGKLPEVLDVFQADERKLVPLVSIARCIPLEQWASARQNKQFVALVNILKRIYMKHSDADILKEIGASLRHLCVDNTGNSLAREGESLVREMAAEMAEKMIELTADEDNLEGDVVLEMRTLVARAYFVYSQMHIPELSISSQMAKMIDSFVEDGDEEVTTYLLKWSMVDLLWLVKALNVDEPEREALRKVGKLQLRLLFLLEKILGNKKRSEITLSTAFDIASDLFVTFSERLSETTLGPLVVHPSDELRQLYLQRFLSVMKSKPSRSTTASTVEDSKLATLASASKVAAFGVPMHKELCATFLAHYGDEDYDKFVKWIVTKLRDSGVENLLRMQQLTLQKLFAEEQPDRVKEMATRFVLVHGLDTKKRSFVSFLREGIAFALKDPPEHIAYLETALVPFVSRSSSKDIQTIIPVFTDAVKKLSSRALGEEDMVKMEQFEQLLRKKGSGQSIATPKTKAKAQALATPQSGSVAKRRREAPSTSPDAQAGEDNLVDDDLSLAPLSPRSPPAKKSKTPQSKKRGRTSTSKRRAPRAPSSEDDSALEDVEEVDETEERETRGKDDIEEAELDVSTAVDPIEDADIDAHDPEESLFNANVSMVSTTRSPTTEWLKRRSRSSRSSAVSQVSTSAVSTPGSKASSKRK